MPLPNPSPSESSPLPPVVVLTTSFPRWRGDHEGSFVHELTRRLSQSASITVIAPHVRGAASEESFDGLTIRRFRYAPAVWEQLCYGAGMIANLQAAWLRFFLLPGFLLCQFLETWRTVRKTRARLLHAHWVIPSGLVAGLVNWFTGVAVLLTAHGSDVMKLRGRWWRVLRRWIMRRSREITVVSRAMRSVLERAGEGELSKKISVIPMGVDTTLFHPAGAAEALAGDPAILFVGWLDRNKGLQYLLRATRELAGRYPGIRAHVIGIGPEQERFEKEVDALGLKGYIRFHGLVRFADMPRYYRGASMFVLPSLSEGVPVSVLEAMASGCPVVVTSVGGVPDVLRHELEGLLVAPKDSSALAAAIKRTLDDPAATAARVQRARTRVAAEFDWQVITRRFEAYYKKRYDA